MNKTQFLLSTAFFPYSFVFISSCHFPRSETNHQFPLTKDSIEQTLSAPSHQTQETLVQGNYTGCVKIPATGWLQKKMVGFKFTGETCSVAVQANNIVIVDFLGNKQVNVKNTSTTSMKTDLFVGKLENNEVLLVQHHQGKVLIATHTSYDNNNHLIYGRSGNGDVFKECLIMDRECRK